MERVGGVQRETQKVKLRNSLAPAEAGWTRAAVTAVLGRRQQGPSIKKEKKGSQKAAGAPAGRSREEQGAHSPGRAQTGEQAQHDSVLG